ncbi:MAG: hypothetical protein K8S87_02225, partial [Planctomycetes bacterium]|nr:hypothetical protein [Planctomycetota bacterium]
MNTINSQASRLKIGYVYVVVFLVASLMGLFFGYSGALEDAGVSGVDEVYLVQDLEPVSQNVFSNIFYGSFKFDFMLRVFLLAGIAVFVVNICGIRKFIPALIFTGLIAAHPFLIAVFKVQAAFSIIPAMFFGLLAVVLTLNIKTRLKLLSYLALLVSALFMPIIAIAFAFITLLYQMLPVNVSEQPKAKRDSKRFVPVAFTSFFMLLFFEQVLLADFINISFFDEINLAFSVSHVGEGAIFLVFPFTERLSTFTGSTAGGVGFAIICIVALAFIVLTMRPFFRKNAKLENIKQKLTVLYWSVGLLIFLVLSVVSHELSERANSTAFFAGVAVLICIYAFVSKLKFKIGMVFGLAGSAFAIVLLITSLLTQASWSTSESLMSSLKDSKEYCGFASAHLAEIFYEKAQKTNNPQRFDEYHKEFKAQFADYMNDLSKTPAEADEFGIVNT